MIATAPYESNPLFRLYCGLQAEHERNWALEDFFGGGMSGGVSAWVCEARVTAADADALALLIKERQASLTKTALIFNATVLAGLFALSYFAIGKLTPAAIFALTMLALGASVILSKDARQGLRAATAALHAYQTPGTDPGPRDVDPAKALYEHCLAKRYFSTLEVQAIRLMRVNTKFFDHP